MWKTHIIFPPLYEIDRASGLQALQTNVIKQQASDSKADEVNFTNHYIYIQLSTLHVSNHYTPRNKPQQKKIHLNYFFEHTWKTANNGNALSCSLWCFVCSETFGSYYFHQDKDITSLDMKIFALFHDLLQTLVLCHKIVKASSLNINMDDMLILKYNRNA